jgi:hypothetical protein
MVLLVQPEQMVHKDLKAPKGQLEQMVHKDLKGHKDQPELMALLEQPELMG